MNNIIIAGAGVFGTALAERLAGNPQNRVTLYTIEPDVLEDINLRHQNSKYFPGRHIRKEIIAVDDIACAYQADYLFLVIPSKVIEGFSRLLLGKLKENCL
ncbi:MAG: glycerol-3-phosphate dehydrogenase, partial [Spirochaetales bacterium]|nr:glycerol-3-phosphate dehydrogenase [Spirochaetales bacterium]